MWFSCSSNPSMGVVGGDLFDDGEAFLAYFFVHEVESVRSWEGLVDVASGSDFEVFAIESEVGASDPCGARRSALVAADL